MRLIMRLIMRHASRQSALCRQPEGIKRCIGTFPCRHSFAIHIALLVGARGVLCTRTRL